MEFKLPFINNRIEQNEAMVPKERFEFLTMLKKYELYLDGMGMRLEGPTDKRSQAMLAEIKKFYQKHKDIIGGREELVILNQEQDYPVEDIGSVDELRVYITRDSIFQNPEPSNQDE